MTNSENLKIAKNVVKEVLRDIRPKRYKWTFDEKVLFYVILCEIVYVNGKTDLSKIEKSFIAKSQFEIGVLDGHEAMEIQDVANVEYDDIIGTRREGIINNFNKLGSLKKDFIINKISELIKFSKVDKKLSLKVAFDFFGNQGGKFSL